jgi:hypothetical protein
MRSNGSAQNGMKLPWMMRTEIIAEVVDKKEVNTKEFLLKREHRGSFNVILLHAQVLF